MRGLARTQPSAKVRDSILRIFDAAGTSLAGLTAFDRADLASLYRNIPNIPAAQIVAGVSRQLHPQAAREGR